LSEARARSSLLVDLIMAYISSIREEHA